MKYKKEITLMDGRECLLRSCTEADAQAAVDNFLLTHSETDFLLSNPDEVTMTAEDEAKFLKTKDESDKEVEIFAVLDGKIVATAGTNIIGTHRKVSHRAGFGISVERKYWGLGIGKALTAACIECAKTAGFEQLELTVVSDNDRAVALYKHLGFEEIGRNPKGFKSDINGYQELIYMRLELN